MALPYKLLKSLTIGGQTQGLDPNLGKQVDASLNKNIPTANTEIAGASMTITEAGLYLFSSRWIFGGSSSTGTRFLRVALWYKKNGGNWVGATDASQILPSAGNGAIMSAPTVIIPFSESEVPATVTLYATSDKTSSEAKETSIGSTKLIDIYHNFLGGGNTTP